MPGDFMKGGLRYKRVKRRVNERLADEGVLAFFIGTGSRLLRTPNPLSAAQALATSEHVVAVTPTAVYLIPIRGPGVFSARLAEPVERIPLTEASASLHERTVTVNGRAFNVFPYHDEDAAALVEIVARQAAS